MPRLACRSISLACALTLPVVSLPDPAGATEPAETAGSDEDTRAEAERLYNEGRARYETLDYTGAIELWTQAYSMVPESDEGRAIRAALVYNIAQAQEKAFDVDHDVVHLRQAKGLLERYLADFEALYESTPENKAEADKVRTRIDELTERIERASEGSASQTDPRAAARARQEEARKKREEARKKELEHRKRADALFAKDPKLSAQLKKGKTMMIAGGVVLGVGVLTLATGLYLAWNGYIIGGGVTAGVGGLTAIPGAVVLPLGVTRFKRARAEAMKRTEVTMVPTVLPGGAGLTFAGRF